VGELFRINNRIRILIYSNDHRPAHVHVIVRAEGIEFKVFLTDLSCDYITEKQLSTRDEQIVIRFIEKNKNFIMEAWNEIQKDQ
jgi:hypothetical protein